MSATAELSGLRLKSDERLRDEEHEDDDIPAFLRRPAPSAPQASQRLSCKTAASFVLLIFASSYCLTYLYRSLPALISEPLVKDLGLTPGDLGILSATFFLTTAALQLPIGVWLDRYGPRRVQGLLMIGAVLGAVLCASTDNIVLLTMARALIGIGVAGGFLAGLKAITLWFPPERMALANSWFVMFGSLGACLATWPSAWVMAEIGWRGLFLLLASLTAISLLAILVLVPEKKRQQTDAGHVNPISILSIYRDAGFWRLAPLSALSIGSSWALQGLWAAPWFGIVEGIDRHTIVIYLFVMAAALAPSALLLGIAVHRLSRRGISVVSMFGFVTALGMCAELALILQLPLPPILPWLAIAGIGTAMVLSFTILGQMFPSSGRANAALHVFHLIAAFLVQSGIGFIIELWTPIESQFPAIAYQSAFAVVLAAQFIAWCVFVWPQRIRIADHLHAHPLHTLARRLGGEAAVAVPYFQARQIWTVRLLDARQQCQAWRRAGLASLAVTGCLGLWLAWTAMDAKIVPHLVKVASVHEAGEIWRVPVSSSLTRAASPAHGNDLRERSDNDRSAQ